MAGGGGEYVGRRRLRVEPTGTTEKKNQRDLWVEPKRTRHFLVREEW